MTAMVDLIKNNRSSDVTSNPTKGATSQLPPSSGLTGIVKRTGQSVVRSTRSLSSSLKGIGKSAVRQTYNWLEYGTHGAGHAVTWVGNIPLLRRLAGVLRLDWLVGVGDRVDLVKAQAEVDQLQQQYPDESPSQIAHRIMLKKAILAGGIGLASSLLPGFAIALLAVDLAATTALQTEMVYQIAAAYGMDMRDPARKGEVLGIFGLALGGRNALKAGLGFLRNVPLAGAMIGASTNATMLYALGYTARQYYEAKSATNTGEVSVERLQSIQQNSEQYLNIAIAQQAVMDQILVHMILVSQPDKTWEQILPELQKLQLNAYSLNTITYHIKSPEPLGALLQQLNCDFAVSLLAQCRRIAEQDGTISPDESAILEAIAEKCPESFKDF